MTFVKIYALICFLSCLSACTNGNSFIPLSTEPDLPSLHQNLERLSSKQAIHTPSKTISLREAMLLALRNNPQIERSKLQRVLDKFSLERVHYTFMPKFGMTAGVDYNQGQPIHYWASPNVVLKTPIGTTLTTSYNNSFSANTQSVQVDIEQPLLNGAGWFINTLPLKNADDQEKMNQLAFQDTISQVMIQVIKSYRQLIQDQHQLAVQEQASKHSMARIKQAEIKLHAGIISSSDLIEQRAQLATVQLNIANQKMEDQSHYYQFLTLLGLKSSAHIKINTHLSNHTIMIPTPSAAVREALKHNIDYQKTLISLRLKQRALEATKRNTWWTLNLKAGTSLTLPPSMQASAASYNNGDAAPVSSRSQLYYIGLNLDIPFQDLGTKQAILSARIDLYDEMLTLRQQKESFTNDISNAIDHLHQEKKSIEATKMVVKLYQQNLKNGQIKLKFGRITQFEFNGLQDALVLKKIELIDKKINFLNAMTDFNHILGKTLENWSIHLQA